ncbi:MAG: phosphatase PAP2 family protein [Chloroflexi bacterium]|nr:phosphatase PAP2 family protein [Chloroflexota bacterium]
MTQFCSFVKCHILELHPGHTAFGFFVLPVVLLFRKNKVHYTIAWVLVMLWGTVAAFSQVAIGAHFPSDVLFGAGETIL